MPIDLDALPDDPAILQRMLREVVAATTQQNAALSAENDKLRLLIQRLTRHQFGRRSEQLDADQFQLGLEDIEQTIAENEAAQDAADAARHQGRQRRDVRPNRNLGALPAHLPRYEVVIDVESRECPCCGGALHPIDELRTEQLDIAPAQLRVRVTRRPRYACRSCEGAVVVAPAPERPIDGGMATEALVAHVAVSKFCDSLPLYRQAQMLARQGVTLDRSTLSNWVGRACWWLMPLYDLVVSTVLSSDKLFADDTALPVLDPGRGRTRTGRLWCYAVDDRPWCGPTHPAAAYVYSEDRKGARPAEHLARFQGVLQVDGYDGFKRIAGDRADGSMQLAFCWAHMRRGFYQFYVSTKSPLAAEVLARIRDLYAIEAEIRGHPANHRKANAPGAKSAHRRSFACLVAGSAQTGVRRLRLGKGHALRAAALAGPDRVPRRRPRRDGHQRGRASYQATYPDAQERVVRGLRWRCATLGNRHDADPDGKAQRRRPDGMACRRAPTPRLGPYQSP